MKLTIFFILINIFSIAIYAEWRDPTQPYDSDIQESIVDDPKDLKDVTDINQELKVSAIMGAEKKIAVINGFIVKEGDTIGGRTIQKINKNEIILIDKDKKEQLRLPQRNIRIDKYE